MRISKQHLEKVCNAVAKRADKLGLDYPQDVYNSIAYMIACSYATPCKYAAAMKEGELAMLCHCLYDVKFITVNSGIVEALTDNN